MLVAPSEPPTIKQLGKSSSVPEKFGADILINLPGKIVGIQRKEYRDLLASIHDGRIQKELAQLKRCDVAMLIIEGQPRFTLDGVLITGTMRGYRWTRKQHHNFITSVQDKGVLVQITADMNETVDAARNLESWLSTRGKSSSLDRRPKPRGEWGRLSSQEYALHLMQSFEGIGPIQAQAIINHFGGVPLVWLCTEKQLTQVPGIGKVRARRLIEALARTQSGGN